MTSLTRLASSPLAVPVDASTAYTATGTGEPWPGTMTVQTTLHLTLTLTPLGGEDLSIEPGRGIGGVHLGDTLDAVRRLYPHLAIVRRVDGGKGHALLADRGARRVARLRVAGDRQDTRSRWLEATRLGNSSRGRDDLCDVRAA